MSYPTKEAFIHSGPWDDETRKHPAMKWMEHYTKNIVDERKFMSESADSLGHTSDWTYQKSTGETFEGNEKAVDALKETYAPFSAHVHDPTFVVCWETEKGWESTFSPRTIARYCL